MPGKGACFYTNRQRIADCSSICAPAKRNVGLVLAVAATVSGALALVRRTAPRVRITALIAKHDHTADNSAVLRQHRLRLDQKRALVGARFDLQDGRDAAFLEKRATVGRSLSTRLVVNWVRFLNRFGPQHSVYVG